MTEQGVKESFQGWITSEYYNLYINMGKNVKVYDFNKQEPLISHENLHTIKDDLPGWLQVAFDDNAFNLEDYQSKALMKFVIDELLGPVCEKDNELGEKMKIIFQQFIKAKGDGVKIAHSNEEDIKINDDINILCAKVADNINFEEILNEFVQKIEIDDIAKLGVLLGQYAKQGVLGYEHSDNINQANDLFYLLSKKCFEELNERDNNTKDTFPDNFLKDFNAGVCIEELTNDFLSKNERVYCVFSTKN